jgi:3-oxoacyl-[acyl-carrier-protein] synthase II
MGAVSPLGNTLQESWCNLMVVADSADQRRSGVTSLEETLRKHQNLSDDEFDREWKLAQTLPCQVAAPVRSLEYDRKRTARFVQMALVAGREALNQAGLMKWLEEGHDETRDRVGVCIGSGMSGVREITQAMDNVATGGIRKLSPQFIPKVLTNSASGRLSLEHDLRGPNLSPSTACAAGSHAIGDAMRAIQYGTADVMVAGGTEASIEPLGMAGFCRLRALSTGFAPELSSRPFDRRRDGFVMGEGSALLVLEELDHAKERGANILAEVCGYGTSGDAYHITAPDEAGRGAERAMRMALHDAGTLVPNASSKLGYVNAHATSTPKGDEIEAMVIDRVLRSSNEPSGQVFVSSTKGATGHLLGAAGALEAAFTVMTLVDQQIPPTLNLEDAEMGAENSFEPSFAHVTQYAIRSTQKIDIAMSNSFGFGGTNASLVFCTYDGK